MTIVQPLYVTSLYYAGYNFGMEALWEHLRQFWLEQGVKLNRPVTDAEIEEFERTHHVAMPLDFKSYLLSLNGMDDKSYVTDDDLICFWSLRNIKPLTEEDSEYAENITDAERYFIFADHSIRCHDFAIHFPADSSESSSIYVLYAEPQKIASNFTEFIERYIARDVEVIFPTPR